MKAVLRVNRLNSSGIVTLPRASLAESTTLYVTSFKSLLRMSRTASNVQCQQWNATQTSRLHLRLKVHSLPSISLSLSSLMARVSVTGS
jgi:hypothetical protein